MVLLGTLYPLLADALDLGKISVGPPYFGLLFTLADGAAGAAAAVRPADPLAARRTRQGRCACWLPWAALAVVAGVDRVLRLARTAAWKTAVGYVAGVWLMLGTLRFVWHRFEQWQGPLHRRKCSA